MTHSRGWILVMAGTGLLTIGQLQAQPYWPDTGGSVIRDGFAGCVKTMDWKPELATTECGAPPPAAPPKPAPVVIEAPPPAPVPAPTPIVPAPAPPEPITLSGDTSFALGSDELSPTARAELDRLAERILALESVDGIEIAGHTDSLGAAAYNQSLSERRAESVKRYLVERGVDAEIVHTSGYGITRPIADNATPEGRAANRRVEITIHGAR